MKDLDEIIVEIDVAVVVDGEVKRLDFPVPYDYDGQEIMRLLQDDILPLGALPDDSEGEGDEEWPGDVAGEMDWDTFDSWRSRGADLLEIDCASSELEEAGLLPGAWPGALDLRTGEPTTDGLEETIEHDLRNARIVSNGTKAAFRALRESCGASQAALADALGVSTRAVKRWEAPGQPEPPSDAWRLVESWHHDAVSGAHWHVSQAEELRDEWHEAYTLVLYRNQEEFDRALSPILAQAPSYRWQDAIAGAREKAIAETGSDSSFEIDRPYTNFPGTRSYWRANAAAKLAAALMAERHIPCGFAFPGEQQDSLFQEGVWVPRADVQRIETAHGTIVVCGMR